MPGSTFKKCTTCQSTIGVASKKCKHCGELQPYKDLQRKKLEKAKERTRQTPGRKSNAVKIVDAAKVHLHKLQAAGYTPIILLGKKKGSKVKSELLKLSENSSPEEHEACQTIQSAFENFLNVHFDGTTPPATSSSSTIPPISSQPLPHQSSTNSHHCTLLTMPTSSSTASVPQTITVTFSTSTSSQPTHNPSTPSISVTFLPPHHTAIPPVSASPALNTSSIPPPTPTISTNPASSSPISYPFPGSGQQKEKGGDVIPPEGTALQDENPDRSPAESSSLTPVTDATTAPDLLPTVQSNAPRSRGAKRTKPKTPQRKAKPRDGSNGPNYWRRKKGQKEMKRRWRGWNNSGAKHQNHCCESAAELQAKIASLEELHSDLQNTTSELVKQVKQLKDLVGAYKAHCEVPAKMDKVENPINAKKTQIPPEDPILTQSFLKSGSETLRMSSPSLLSHDLDDIYLDIILANETSQMVESDAYNIHNPINSTSQNMSRLEESTLIELLADSRYDRPMSVVPNLDAEMDEENNEEANEWRS
ncbi:uncharacterized protein [Salminus brasiliensis]|uniref:uncharacterized protein n=1 Tax=Salminus brasiliensis TaxID=930266 RepID=UPI003B834701